MQCAWFSLLLQIFIDWFKEKTEKEGKGNQSTHCSVVALRWCWGLNLWPLVLRCLPSCLLLLSPRSLLLLFCWGLRHARAITMLSTLETAYHWLPIPGHCPLLPVGAKLRAWLGSHGTTSSSWLFCLDWLANTCFKCTLQTSDGSGSSQERSKKCL